MVGVHRGNKQGRDRGDPERKTRSKMPPGGHLRPLGGGFIITVARTNAGCICRALRGRGFLEALPQRTNADCIAGCGAVHTELALCLSAQMRIASAILHKNAISFFADYAVSRQSRTDNRPVFMVRTAPVSSVNFCFALTRGCFCGFPYWKVFLAFQTIFGLTDRGIEEIADSLVVRIADCISLPVNQSAAAGKQNKDLSEHAGHPALCSIAVTAALEYIHRSDDCTGWLWPIAAHRLSPEGREIHTFVAVFQSGSKVPCLR